MNKKLLYVIVAIIIVVGLIMGITKGFNLGFNYSESEMIEVYVDQEISDNDIENIVNEVFGDENKRIQTVEFFKDTVAITAPSISDEQIQKLLERMNEKYSLEYKVEDIEKTKIPSVEIMDVVKDYITPAIVIVVISAIYMAIRYSKLGLGKVLAKTIALPIIAESMLASIYTICRIPVDEFTMPIALIVLGLSIFGISMCLDKSLHNVHNIKDNHLDCNL